MRWLTATTPKVSAAQDGMQPVPGRLDGSALACAASAAIAWNWTTKAAQMMVQAMLQLVLAVTGAISSGFNFGADILKHWFSHSRPRFFQRSDLHRRMARSRCYSEWRSLASELDRLKGNHRWKMRFESEDYDYSLVRDRLDELYQARQSNDKVKSAFLLRSTLLRNLGGMANPRLFARCHVGTKDLVEQYVDEVVYQLHQLATENIPNMSQQEKIDFFVATRQAYGNSALLLSGGAGLGIHHVGVLKALHQVGLIPRIVSGSSVGSLIGALLCVTPENELDKLFDGSLAAIPSHSFLGREGEPTAWNQRLSRYLRSGVLADIDILKEACQANFGDMTFQEAYDRSKRILNVTVNSRGPHDVPRLLNYLTSPSVVIWTAVCASCALQMLFEEVEILAKDCNGNIRPWNPPGVKWSDGSVASDLPMDRLRELFNVNHFIVSQVNPHVIPLYNLYQHFPRLMRLFWSELDFRLGQLAAFGVLPNVLRNIRSVLAQQYSGDITIVPDVGIKEYLSIMSNPTPESFERACCLGERATWPKVSVILNQLKIELALDDIVQSLRGLERWQLV